MTSAAPIQAQEYIAVCGGVKIKVRKAGARWLMWAGGVQRTDFASPSAEHAMQTAEHWYGQPAAGWEES